MEVVILQTLKLKLGGGATREYKWHDKEELEMISANDETFS